MARQPADTWLDSLLADYDMQSPLRIEQHVSFFVICRYNITGLARIVIAGASV